MTPMTSSAAQPTPAWRTVLEPLFGAVAAGDARRAAACLRALPGAVAELLPRAWIEANATALERGDYEPLSQRFVDSEFRGPQGHVLIVAPYAVRRSTGDITKLSALFAQVMPYEPMPRLAETIERIQGAKLRTPITVMYPTRRLAVCGTLEEEAFLVPDGWGWRDSALGPAFFEIAEAIPTGGASGDAIGEAGRKCIRRIFDADTAACLLAPLEGDHGAKVHFRAFEIHDASHSSGLGLARKIREALIPGYWYRGVEEWRADGIGFELGAGLLSPEDAAADVAANFYVRFGGVAATASGPDGPTEHTPCALLMLDRLLREGNLVAKGERLALRDPSPRGLVRAMEPQRHEVIELTRRELDLPDACGVMRLYGSMNLHPATLVVFEAMMRAPTRGFYDAVA